jgi:hypothetical protein
VPSDARLFCYKMTHDGGFAPNPFWGCLTLATCKPGIRRTKGVGDWIAGFTSGTLNGDAVGEERLVFLMEVGERLTVAEYFRDKRFKDKIPRTNASDHKRLVGDNIYRPLIDRAIDPQDFEQIGNPSHKPEDLVHDVSGRNVLIACWFAYFGRKAIAVPPDVHPEVPIGQSSAGQQTRDLERRRSFVNYVKTMADKKGGILGMPHVWPSEIDMPNEKKPCGVRKRAPVPRCDPPSRSRTSC